MDEFSKKASEKSGTKYSEAFKLVSECRRIYHSLCQNVCSWYRSDADDLEIMRRVCNRSQIQKAGIPTSKIQKIQNLWRPKLEKAKVKREKI